MLEHTRDKHDGVVGDAGGKFDYSMSVTDRFRKCLQRQVNEGVLIQKCEIKVTTY